MENNEYVKSLDEAVEETLSAAPDNPDDEPCIAVPVSEYTRFIYNDIILHFVARASKELYHDEITAFLMKCALNPEYEVKHDVT